METWKLMLLLVGLGVIGFGLAAGCSLLQGESDAPLPSSGELPTEDVRFKTAFAQPAGLAWDGERLWVGDQRTGQIDVMSFSGESLATLDQQVSYPGGLAWDGDGLWMADAGRGKLKHVDPASGDTLNQFAAPGEAFPIGIAWAEASQTLWIADGGTTRVFQVDPTDGSVLNEWDSSSDRPSGVAWNGQNVWLLDEGTRLVELDPDNGQVVSERTNVPGSQLSGLAWIDGKLWATDAAEGRVYSFSP